MYLLFVAAALFVFMPRLSTATETQSRIPVILTTPGMLDRAKARLASGEIDATLAWQRLEKRAIAATKRSWTPYHGRDHEAYFGTALNQGFDLRALAVAYRLSGNQNYLLAIQRAFTVFTSAHSAYPFGRVDNPHSVGMVVGRAMPLFADALMLTSSDADPKLVTTARSWIASFRESILLSQRLWQFGTLPAFPPPWFGEQNFNNHLGAQMLGLLTIAFVTSDELGIHYALTSEDNPRNLTTLLEDAIFMEGEVNLYKNDPTLLSGAPWPASGELYDRYRIKQSKGLHYSMLHLRCLTLAAKMAQENGNGDFFEKPGSKGERLDYSFGFYAEFVLTNRTDVQTGYYRNDDSVDRSLQALYRLIVDKYPHNTAIQLVANMEPIRDSQTFDDWWPLLF